MSWLLKKFKVKQNKTTWRYNKKWKIAGQETCIMFIVRPGYYATKTSTLLFLVFCQIYNILNANCNNFCQGFQQILKLPLEMSTQCP